MTAETKDVLRFGMVIVGLGALLGSIVGATFGIFRTSFHCWCCDGVDANC